MRHPYYKDVRENELRRSGQEGAKAPPSVEGPADPSSMSVSGKGGGAAAGGNAATRQNRTLESLSNQANGYSPVPPNIVMDPSPSLSITQSKMAASDSKQPKALPNISGLSGGEQAPSNSLRLASTQVGLVPAAQAKAIGGNNSMAVAAPTPAALPPIIAGMLQSQNQQSGRQQQAKATAPSAATTTSNSNASAAAALASQRKRRKYRFGGVASGSVAAQGSGQPQPLQSQVKAAPSAAEFKSSGDTKMAPVGNANGKNNYLNHRR